MKKATILQVLAGRKEQIRQRFGVKSLSVFGSAARDEMHKGSDVDVLVQFEGPATFDGYMDLKFYLEEILGCPVDLVTDKGLRREIRPAVEQEAIRVA
jgi:predicted nucleotidyltransferase